MEPMALCVFSFIVLFTLNIRADAELSGTMRPPWEAAKNRFGTQTSPSKLNSIAGTKHQNKRENTSFAQLPAYTALRIYQEVISPTKGRDCPSYPSCSAYSIQALQQYGLLQGLLMTADRLHRCGHDVQYFPLIETPGGTRYEDPPYLNDITYFHKR